MPETGDTYPVKDKWHVTRGIPLALILTFFTAIFGQTVGAVWYMSHLDSRVDVLEKAQILAQPQAERLTRLEEKVVSVQATASRIETAVTALSVAKR